ncbi:protein of unknown function [Taphrina deformans PYCC 5710]|uniref:Arrestin C-terminal-like domain-containing protein n=1 Tax=Taphrina deformans (strain PYCC 5710 / ATCC 11124 / CBS 356.35 / IMI 108563 / JCM 9778 / NBRC 8474) TaxID=1097556 RepID=R5A1P2_TAPDE|nr:protein of unknown function [Taphrina deformans PYCC 5710]|eukprot:CCX35427.1 protein of unknown function [Taphrina deformans PYCC 5710]
MSFGNAHDGAMYHEEALSLPRKPNEYQRMLSSGSMNDLLKSLNIDDDYSPQPATARQAESSAMIERQLNHTRPHAVSMPPVPVAQNYLPSAHTAAEYQNNRQTAHRTRIPDAETSWQQYDGNQAEFTSAPQSFQDNEQPIVGARDRPTRKPVDNSPKARTYFSPDDLDELIKDHPRYRQEAQTRQDFHEPRSNFAGLSAVNSQMPLSREMQPGYNAPVPTGRQLPSVGRDLSSQRAILPMPETMANPSRYGSPINEHGLEERFHPFAFVKTNKFKIKVYPYQEPFVAGGEIFGHIDIISDEGFRAQLGSTQVSIGEIGVEVIGYEEIQHTETGHNPRSFTFMYSRKIFQLPAETHPERAMEEHILTSAVLNSPPPDKDGYRSASKGTTSFPFSFQLPVDAPSSADLHTARIRYLVTGYATVKLQGSHEVIATSIPIRVVEAWDVDNPVYEQPIEAAYGRDIANYHEIAATAKIARSLYIEGQTISGIIRVANHSSRKIREVKFQLMNKITFFGDKRPPLYDLNPSEDHAIEMSVHGHAEPHVLAHGEEESWTFNLSIPEDRCVSVRNTALFEVTPFILIKISTGPLQKSTRLEMPVVSIANPESLVDHHQRLAPTSDMMKWSNLPFLYRYQVVNDGAPGVAQKGTFEVLDLITYFSAEERVMLLSTG